MLFELCPLIILTYLVGSLQTTSVSICSGDYKFFNQLFYCEFGKQIEIVQVDKVFNWQGQLPECSSPEGYKYSDAYPFWQECNGKQSCLISTSFIETYKLFSAETYVLPTPLLYGIPYRIDITYQCSQYQKEKKICYDDLKWLENGQIEYVLDCFLPGITSIRLLEASALFTNEVSSHHWTETSYMRPDCQSQMDQWTNKKLNYTFSAQNECLKNLVPLQSYNSGAFCRIKVPFLIVNIFRTHWSLIGTNVHPYPYGFYVKYTCT